MSLYISKCPNFVIGHHIGQNPVINVYKVIGADGEGRKEILSVRRLTAETSYSNIIPLAADIVCLRRDRDCLMISGDV